jgi:ribonucleotide reductase alpha subunit
MTAEAQPFISGALSNTINLPAMATVEDCAKAYLDRVRRRGRSAWRGETARTFAPRLFGQLGTVVPRSQVSPR